MNGIDSNALDRYITGNYGEDQYKDSEVCDGCDHGEEVDCGKDPCTCKIEKKESYLQEQADRLREDMQLRKK
jgi:hypothetical protein